MFDLGWTELLVIGIVALIVVGPKDLPVLFQQVGRFVGKAKGMAREFSSAMNQAADEAGVKEAASSFKSATDGLNTISNPAKAAMDSVKDAAKSMTSLDLESDDKPEDKLSDERASAAAKIQEATAQKAQARIDAEQARAAADAEAKDKE
ncbi:MAG: Sec-independent protein translocase protein TatB [Cognatishimia sp.]